MKDFAGAASETSLADTAMVSPHGASSFENQVGFASHAFPELVPVAPSTPQRQGKTLYARGGKRALDLFLIAVTLPLTLPLILISALLLATEGKPIFYWQKRVGQHGRVFRMLKLRTMVPGADQILADYLERCPDMQHEWETTQKLKHDPRITKFGKLLRASSIDELPQLWNVVKGDMSLVGPRPMMPCQTAIYGNMRAYEAMRPGLTGLWQVTDRNESDFTSRVTADRKYARFNSLRFDLTIIAKTVGVVLRGTGY
ncbi:MAG: sugar transferase [Pseudomonadota bacterium]